MGAKLDRSEIFRLEYISPREAYKLYRRAAEILLARLKHVSEKVLELEDPISKNKWVDKTLVADFNGRIVGSLVYDFERFRDNSKQKEALCVRYLGTVIGEENRGIGSALLNEAEIIAKESNLDAITLRTFKPNLGEIDLPAWYGKKGFEPTNHYYNSQFKRTLVDMQKSL